MTTLDVGRTHRAAQQRRDDKSLACDGGDRDADRRGDRRPDGGGRDHRQRHLVPDPPHGHLDDVARRVVVPPHPLVRVEDAAALMAEKAQSKGLELIVHVDRDVPARLIGDPGRTRQVVLNLVGNAVKFTAHGEVLVHLRRIDGTSTIDGRVWLAIDIRDTGIGMGAETRGKLFQPFSQADASTTRQYGGTGLGLAISQRLIEAMGGAIEVSSEPGRGSLFWFEVELGRRAGDRIEVTSGLEEGQRVVASGQFLIDSEASLTGALDRLRRPCHNGATLPPHG